MCTGPQFTGKPPSSCSRLLLARQQLAHMANGQCHLPACSFRGSHTNTEPPPCVAATYRVRTHHMSSITYAANLCASDGGPCYSCMVWLGLQRMAACHGCLSDLVSEADSPWVLPQGIAHPFLCPEMNINEWPWESDNMCRGAAAKPMWSRGER